MASTVLKGDTLGQKHKHYNQLLNDALSGNIKISSHPDDDIGNLLLIDMASQNKDVHFILNAFKSTDMLYVSWAIKKSNWLITEKTYSNFINPNYLNSDIFPHMMTKAINKLMLHIRLHLKDEERVEQFYRNEKVPSDAAKWLCNCSVKFIEDNVNKHNNDNRLLKRLCEKSISILEKIDNHNSVLLQKTTFFLKNETNRYLNIVERVPYYNRPTFNAKATDLIMKKCPERIINNFEKYAINIHMPTFARYLKSENISDFLTKQIKSAEDDSNLSMFLKSDQVLYLFQRIRPPQRYEFVKAMFLDDKDEVNENDPKKQSIQLFFNKCDMEKYIWYKYAPFDVAFVAIKKSLQVESSARDKKAMLQTLIYCAKQNLSDIQTLLRYYSKKHIKDSFSSKCNFVSELSKNTEIHKYDETTWDVLNEIFSGMGLYNPSSEKDQNCIQTIIVYKVLHNETVPEVIMNKFEFETLSAYKKLTEEDGVKIFNFLFDHLLTKVQTTVSTQDELADLESNLINTLTLLKDWKKNISEYPSIINKIKEISSIKRKNVWTLDLADLYNVQKSWRKIMFEESIILNPCEEVCVNALKHEPSLLSRYNTEVQDLQCNDNVSLKQVLSKIRIYWPESLALCWSNEYMARLKTLSNHKALTRGLCYLLPHTTLIDIIVSFIPKESKIDFKNVDEVSLSLQKHFAKNMHLARPQPKPEIVMSYAKGDYVKFTLPSLLAVFHNLNAKSSRECLPEFLDAPVSLQKHIIRLAFAELESHELKVIFLNLWQTSKNKTIRGMIFEFTFKLLCKTKDPIEAKNLWDTFEVFIDNLTYEDDKKLFDLLSKVEDVPGNVKPHFLVKSYGFLKRLISNVVNDRGTYEWYLELLEQSTREIMEHMNNEFIENIITEFLEKKFYTFQGKSGPVRSSYGMTTVISAYLLCAKNIESQQRKQENILKPLIKRSLNMWNEYRDGCYFIRQNFQELLYQFTMDLNYYVTSKNMIIPTEMFTEILTELNTLPVSENYVMVTGWKLTLTLAKLLEKTTKTEWELKCTEISQEFAENCVEYLKQDVNSHFPCIYVLFSRALQKIIDISRTDDWKWLLLEKMLSDKDFVQSFLTVNCILTKNNGQGCESTKQNITKITNLIKEHPSVEVKMHYYYKFGDGNRGCKEECVPWAR